MPLDYREEFDIPRDVCYLNTAYMGVQPRAVVEAAIRGARRRARPWQLAPPDFFSDVEALRAAFARQVGCGADHVAIVPSAGYGVACAAANLRVGAGDLVLSLDQQFPSNYYAWRRQTMASGAEFCIVGREAGQTWADALLAAIEREGERIAIATLEMHHWASAEFVDLDAVMPALRDAGIRVVLDLTQTVGAYPLDIARLAPDFMVSAGYKWQLCPYGVAFLYVDERYFDGRPVEEAWMNRDGAEDFSRLADFTDRYQPGARRYDVSEKSSFSNVAAALAALTLIDDWGIATISDTLSATNRRIAGILESYGFESRPAQLRAPHFQSARLPATDPRDLADRLLARGVYASVRGDNLRVAPYLYTDEEDLARFESALGEALT